METRVGNQWKQSLNERKFIESALLSDLRIDGRRPFEYRTLTINFGKSDGSAEVQLGQTHVMGFVSAQLTHPYRDRPNEGSLSIFTEFSPMADPSFEPGRPSEFAVELGRVVDRGLRESRAVDTESLCVLPAKFVWAVRIDLHIIDNGGNLVDAANVAALAALMTFRRPECSLEGDDGQQVIVHPPEERDPLPLIIHHLPIAITFAIFRKESGVMIDPTYHEEAVMGGRMTVTLNANGDICAIQKAGGEGVAQSVIMQCLRIASVKAADITEKLKESVEAFNTTRALKKIKRHPLPIPVDLKEEENSSADKLSKYSGPDESGIVEDLKKKANDSAKKFIGGASSWSPYSEGVDPNLLKSSLASPGTSVSTTKHQRLGKEKSQVINVDKSPEAVKEESMSVETVQVEPQSKGEKTLTDAVKPKNKRKKKSSSGAS